MKKKLFYNKRHRVPIWSQIYLAWFVVFVIGILSIRFFNVIEAPSEIKNTYNYKQEYESISSTHLKVLNAYPNAHEWNQTLINNINEDINRKKWHVEELSSEYHKSNCKFTRYFVENEKSNLVVLFDHESITNTFYLMQTLVSALINEKLHNIAVISVDGGPLCSGYALKRYEQNTNSNIRYLHILFGKNSKPVLNIVSSTGNVSSILWSGITPESINRPSLFTQLAQAAILLFQKSVYSETATSLNGIGWVFSNEMKNEVNAIHTILPPLLFTVRNYSQINSKTTNNSFWTGKDKALSNKGRVVLSCLMMLLIWLPVANRFYESEQVNHLFRSFFSAIYSSIVFFIIAGYVKLGSHFMPVSITATLFIPLIFIVLHFLFNKAKKNIFDLNANLLTEFIVLNVFASILVFYNFSIFILLLPVIFAANKKSDTGFSAFKILLFLSMIPLLYASYTVLASVGIENSASLLSLAWIERCIFSGLTASMILFLCGGSILSIARESK